MNKKDWLAILFLIFCIAIISLNELGYGAIAFPVLILPTCWLMYEALLKDLPKE